MRASPALRAGLLAVLLAAGPQVRADALGALLEALDLTAPRHRLAAPGFRLDALGGGSGGPDDYAGKALLLHFWATFCDPCRDELPRLEALSRQLGEEGLVVLTVAVDRSPAAAVAAFVAVGGYRLPVLLDPLGRVRNRYEVAVLPTSYLIGRDGRFVARALGARGWDAPDAVAALRSWLRQGAGSP